MLRFERLRIDAEVGHPSWNPLLRIVAVFTLASGSVTIYSEPDFPVVELAVQLARWVDRVRAGGVGDFSYVTLESDEPEWIGFHQVADGVFKVRARYQETDDPETRSLEELVEASDQYIATLVPAVRQKLGIDIAPLLRPTA
jgi:hypothetical protein